MSENNPGADTRKAARFLRNLKVGASCICCDSTVQLQFDHITNQATNPGNQRHATYGIRGRSATGSVKTFKDLKNGLLQILCQSCNLSKGDSSACRLHDTYLGVWNHLPSLDNMELA